MAAFARNPRPTSSEYAQLNSFLLRTQLKCLTNLPRRLNETASKGVHPSASFEETRQGSVGLYFFPFNVCNHLTVNTEAAARRMSIGICVTASCRYSVRRCEPAYGLCERRRSEITEFIQVKRGQGQIGVGILCPFIGLACEILQRSETIVFNRRLATYGCARSQIVDPTHRERER
jgi:hypothetical protein